MELNNSSVERDHFPTHVPFFRRHVAACTGILQVSTAGACKQWPPVVSSQTTRQLMRCYRYTFIWYTDIHLDVKHFLSAPEMDKNIDLSWKIIPPKEQKKREKREAVFKSHLKQVSCKEIQKAKYSSLSKSHCYKKFTEDQRCIKIE